MMKFGHKNIDICWGVCKLKDNFILKLYYDQSKKNKNKRACLTLKELSARSQFYLNLESELIL